MTNTYKLSDLCKIYNGNSISDKKKSDYLNSIDGIPYISTKDIN